MENTQLFEPIQIGDISLKHRVVLAPMTRIRADEATLAPTELTALYYAQRASPGGLLITEAVHISPEATPVWSIYPRVAEVGGHVPGIWTEAQMQAWKTVVKGVHAKGGRIAAPALRFPWVDRFIRWQVPQAQLALCHRQVVPIQLHLLLCQWLKDLLLFRQSHQQKAQTVEQEQQ